MTLVRFGGAALALILAIGTVSALAQVTAPATIAKFYTRVNERRATPFQQALANAADYDLMFSVEPQQVAPLKARKLGLTVLMYELPGGRFRGEGDFNTLNAREELFVHDAAGQRIYNEEKLVLLDMNNPQYRAYEIDLIVKTLQSAPYDGVFLDVVHPQWVHGNRAWSPAIPQATLTAWPVSMLTFFEGLKAKMPAGKRLHLNFLSTRENRLSQWASWEQRALALADGAQMDGFCFNRRNPYSDADFAYQLRRIAEAAAAGKQTLVKAAVKEGGDKVSRLEGFCFGAYLLVADGRNIMYYPAHDLNRSAVRGVGIYEARLGQPLGAFTRPGNLYRREFANGVVIVNPTGASQSLGLSATMISAADRKPVSNAVLEPYSGLVLLKP